MRTDDSKKLKVGDFARNIESGWLGRIEQIVSETVKVSATESFPQLMAKMTGVDLIACIVGRTSWEAALTPDDVQWHAVDDLVLAKR